MTVLHTEVVIVGKGIAGLSLSYLLAQRKIAHLVLDKQPFNIKNMWAETLPPGSIPLLRSMGLFDLFVARAEKTFGYHSCWGGKQIRQDDFMHHDGAKFGLRIRKEAILSDLTQLLNRYILPFRQLIAVETGATPTLRIWHPDEGEMMIKAKLLVDASGRSRALLRALGVKEKPYDDTIAFSRHLPMKRHPALRFPTCVESFAQGWGIVSKLDAQTNVMTLFTNANGNTQAFSRSIKWPELLADTDYLSYFLGGESVQEIPTKKESKVVGSKANSSIAEQLAGSNWLAVGDAALAFDPLSSHGVSNALFSAKTAADSIDEFMGKGGEKALSDYGVLLAQIFAQYHRNRKMIYQQEQRWPNEPFWRGS